MSRSTEKSYVNQFDYKPPVSIGYIYRITDSKAKNSIGSIIDYNKRRVQHEEAGKNMPLHRAIKDQGLEKLFIQSN